MNKNKIRISFEGYFAYEAIEILSAERDDIFKSFNIDVYVWDMSLCICYNILDILVCYPDFYNLYGLRYFLTEVLEDEELLHQWLRKACKISKDARHQEYYFGHHFKMRDEKVKKHSLDFAKVVVGRIIYKCTDNAIYNVFTAAEAAEMWEVEEATINEACSGQNGYPPRFSPEECRRAKGTWLVTEAGIERLYGLMPCLRGE